MKIQQATQSIEVFLRRAKKKSDTRIAESLLETLGSLSERELSQAQRHSIEDALDRILFRDGPEANFKQLKRNRNRFMAFLRDEIALVTPGYYTTLGVALGVAFGASIGTGLQGVSDVSNALALGVALGVALGAAFGGITDSEAARQNKVLNPKAST